MSQPRTLELARARTFANLGVHGGDRSVAQEGKERKGGGTRKILGLIHCVNIACVY